MKANVSKAFEKQARKALKAEGWELEEKREESKDFVIFKGRGEHCHAAFLFVEVSDDPQATLATIKENLGPILGLMSGKGVNYHVVVTDASITDEYLVGLARRTGWGLVVVNQKGERDWQISPRGLLEF
ncbi:MAG: hypothetical protein ACXACI_17300 [Candidatus Hodarchaeales archaeon]